jgi:site-specific DNA-methyltransferase (adenine-specific)
LNNVSKTGFQDSSDFLWDKAASASPSTAWGSWCSPANPTLRDTHEYILVFCKQTFTRPNPYGRASTIGRDEFLEFTRSVWRFPAEPAGKVGHPAPFPEELPYRLIQLYTYEGEVVLDPFIGSGTTAVAAIKARRHFVGWRWRANALKVDLSVHHVHGEGRFRGVLWAGGTREKNIPPAFGVAYGVSERPFWGAEAGSGGMDSLRAFLRPP